MWVRVSRDGSIEALQYLVKKLSQCLTPKI